MQEAMKEAQKGIQRNHGGPFGAVIVKNNKVIAKAHNEVVKQNDPTCHAEMLAIKNACKKLKRFNISDCILYTTCEPCPMCLAAIYWARIKKYYYGCKKQDAEDIGFIDKYIYDIIKNKKKKDHLEKKNIERSACLKVFKQWYNKYDKVRY
jgi:guanine deaminase